MGVLHWVPALLLKCKYPSLEGGSLALPSWCHGMCGSVPGEAALFALAGAQGCLLSLLFLGLAAGLWELIAQSMLLHLGHAGSRRQALGDAAPTNSTGKAGIGLPIPWLSGEVTPEPSRLGELQEEQSMSWLTQPPCPHCWSSVPSIVSLELHLQKRDVSS